jgi:hypothetical protein
LRWFNIDLPFYFARVWTDRFFDAAILPVIHLAISIRTTAFIQSTPPLREGRYFALMLLRFVAEIILHRNNTFVKHFFIVVEIFLS